MTTPHLFTPLTLRGVEIRNRIWASPMCMYSSRDGHPTDWHLMHLGSLAAGGAGLVVQEATAVTPDGRISPDDAGIWSDEQAKDYARITDFIRSQGATPAIQLGHAGRKASTYRPWAPRRGTVPADEGGWQAVAPSAVAFQGYAEPRALEAEELPLIVAAFAEAATRAIGAGYQVVELHAAHGYLLHQFLSPLSNHRTDAYGGTPENRARLTLEVIEAVRDAVGEDVPILLRVSATDWAEGGWDLAGTVELVRRARGVDLVDVSSGGLVAHQQIPVGPGYQVPLARAVRAATGIPVAAVGTITEPVQAEGLLVDGAADAVFLARALLADKHWPLHAAQALGTDGPWPPQYERAR